MTPETTAVATAPASNREELILEHLPQVRLIARRMYERLPGHVSLDDLVSAGTIGLIAAIDRYNGSTGVKLRTYAEYKIRGAILDSLRELDWAPRRQRRRARALQQAANAAEQRTKQAASEADVAAELGIPLQQCQQWMSEIRNLNFTSVDAFMVDSDGRDVPRQIASLDELPNRELERSELQGVLAKALSRMPVPERTVLNLYYHENLTLREIARVMNLHESRISQLRIQALGRLRIVVEKQWPRRGGKLEGRRG
jgi:RNA polymerase sigma factor for flagellar operon FliA